MSRDYGVLSTVAEAKTLAKSLYEEDALIGFDVETGYSGPDFAKRSLDVNNAQQFVVGFSITNDKSWARYIPLRHDNSEGDNLPPAEIWEIFRPVLEQKDIVAHQKKFEDKNLLTLHNKEDISSPIRTRMGYDTLLESYALAETRKHGLKALSKELLGVDQAEIDTLFLSQFPDEKMTAARKNSIRFNRLQVDPSVVAYACDDAALCLELHELMWPKLLEDPERLRVVKMEFIISQMMTDVELFGVGVDWEGMEASYRQYPTFYHNSENYVKRGFEALAGPDSTIDFSTLNLNSVPQMRKLLYEDLGMSTTRTTDKGDLSTDAIALEALSRQHPSVKALLDMREVRNLGNRFKKWITEFRTASDDRVHPNYNQVQVPTGRFSADSPPIQQCPKKWYWQSVDGEPERTPENNGVSYWTGNFRDFIRAGEGNYLLTYDVSQGELRMLAGVAQEPILKEAFETGVDVHTRTAAKMLGKADDEVDRNTERPIGKALPLDATVWTPTGAKTMGEIKVGDEVSTPYGRSKVMEYLPQGVRPIYEITMSDGGKAYADADHLWKVYGNSGLKTTTELRRGDKLPTGVWESREPYYSDTHPYTLGILLAGSATSETALRVQAPENKKRFLLAAPCPDGIEPRVGKSSVGVDFVVYSGGQARARRPGRDTSWRNPIERQLSALKYRFNMPDPKKNPPIVRRGVSSANMFIAPELMRMTADDRLALLRGIVDYLGVPVNGHMTSVSVSSYRFAKDIQKLVWSLGGRARIGRTPDHMRREKRSDYRRNIDVQIVLEKSPYLYSFYSGSWSEVPVLRTVSSIRYVGDEEAACIRLEDERGLFFTDDFIVTHNCQPLDSKVLTPSGYKNMGDMAVGSEIVDPFGDVQFVTGVFPQGVRDAYRVSMSDGSSAESDMEHYWSVSDRLNPAFGYQRLQLQEIVSAGLRTDSGEDRWELPHVSYDAEGSKQTNPEPRRIRSVEFSRTTEQQCISVSAEHMTYITDDGIPTMNTLNFALLYQMQTKALGERLAVPQHEAQRLYDLYFEQFSEVARYVEETKEFGREHEYVKTPFGRRVPLWGYQYVDPAMPERVEGQSDAEYAAACDKAKRKAERSYRINVGNAERACVNYRIQGGLADYVKLSMINCYRVLRQKNLWGNGVMLCMNQHDSLTFEVSNDIDPNELRALLQPCVVFPFRPSGFGDFPVFEADWELGTRWGSSAEFPLDAQAVFRDGVWSVEQSESTYESVNSGDTETTEEEESYLKVAVSLDNPTRENFEALVQTLRKYPGSNKWYLAMKDKHIDLRVGTSLDLTAESRISIACDGATLKEYRE